MITNIVNEKSLYEYQEYYEYNLTILDKIFEDILLNNKNFIEELDKLLTIENVKYNSINESINNLLKIDYNLFSSYITNITAYLTDNNTTTTNRTYLVNIQNLNTYATELVESLTTYYSSNNFNKNENWNNVIEKQKNYINCEDIVLEFIKNL